MTIYTHNLIVASYKSTGKLFNRVVRALDRTNYSHTECAVESRPDGRWLCWSSSYMDGGVRQKLIDINDGKWDLINVPVTIDEYDYAIEYANVVCGQKFDVFGMLGAGFMVAKQNNKKLFCNEMVGNMFKIPEAHRFRPASFHVMMERIAKDRRVNFEV